MNKKMHPKGEWEIGPKTVDDDIETCIRSAFYSTTSFAMNLKGSRKNICFSLVNLQVGHYIESLHCISFVRETGNTFFSPLSFHIIIGDALS